jgi:mRNA interferase RelE/StbE
LAWTIEFEQDAIRQLNRLDTAVRRRIVEYLEKRVAASGDPRQFGKPLRHGKAGLWSYRVGAYRVVACWRASDWSWWSSRSAIVARCSADGRSALPAGDGGGR